MKRSHLDAMGPLVEETPQSEVAATHWKPLTPAIADVTRLLDARGLQEDSDARIVRELAEFLGGRADPEAPILAAADPIFKERLRRRLWRLHRMTQPSSSGDPH